MQRKVILLLLMAILLPDLWAWNLRIRSATRLDNHELLDVQLYEHYAFIPAGLGGLNIVDVADPGNPEVVGEYRASSCQWERLYAWEVSGDYAYGAGRSCGIHVLGIQNIQAPVLTTIYQDPDHPQARYEHVEAGPGNLIYLSRHQAGVEIVSVANPSNPVQRAVVPASNAWRSVVAGDILYVADGGAGVLLVDIQDPSQPQIITTVATSGTAKDIALSGSWLLVATGAAGVDLIDVSNPGAPQLMENYNTSGYASRVAIQDTLVAVSDWDDVEVLSFANGVLSLTGIKNTGGRVMALAMAEDLIYSAEWENFVIHEYGPIDQPDVDFSRRRVQFARTAAGSTRVESLMIRNSGNQDLTLDPVWQNADFDLGALPPSILPGEEVSLRIEYTPGGNNWISRPEFYSNDPDEAVASITLRGNSPWGPMIGDPAPDFQLPLVNGEGILSLETLAGAPTVLAFFTAW